jgi:hypothetical protein
VTVVRASPVRPGTTTRESLTPLGGSGDYWAGPVATTAWDARVQMPSQWIAGRVGSAGRTRPSGRVLSAVLTLLVSISVATPGAILAASPEPDPTDVPAVEGSPAPSIDESPTPTVDLSPDPSAEPSPTTVPEPTPSPVPAPAPAPAPALTPGSPIRLNLYRSAGFRYQNPNYSACTATSVMDMLNFVSLGGQGGLDFRWSRSLSTTKRNAILRWERAHHTMRGGSGTDMHGWRNALNYYGWGTGALRAGSRVYDDFAFTSYGSAMKAAVRAMISTRKPVAMAAWAGRHAVMITGYYALSGDPFAMDDAGKYLDTFTVGGYYLSDPLAQAGRRNARISDARLRASTNANLRFRPYRETDSPYDDRYTPGWRTSRSEWYGKWVLILPLR